MYPGSVAISSCPRSYLTYAGGRILATNGNCNIEQWCSNARAASCVPTVQPSGHLIHSNLKRNWTGIGDIDTDVYATSTRGHWRVAASCGEGLSRAHTIAMRAAAAQEVHLCFRCAAHSLPDKCPQEPTDSLPAGSSAEHTRCGFKDSSTIQMLVPLPSVSVSSQQTHVAPDSICLPD